MNRMSSLINIRFISDVEILFLESYYIFVHVIENHYKVCTMCTDSPMSPEEKPPASVRVYSPPPPPCLPLLYNICVNIDY